MMRLIALLLFAAVASAERVRMEAGTSAEEAAQQVNIGVAA